MKKGTIAVSPGLTDLSQLLKEEGFDVVSSRKELEKAEVVVVSGMDDNFLGMQDVLTAAPVITASGKDAQELLEDVKRCMEVQ